ncbi:MAG: hypothetical protein ACLP1X_05185 [Polyangiaceae bacterium]
MRSLSSTSGDGRMPSASICSGVSGTGRGSIAARSSFSSMSSNEPDACCSSAVARSTTTNSDL